MNGKRKEIGWIWPTRSGQLYEDIAVVRDFFQWDTFDLGRSIPNRPWTVTEQVRPRWSGHDVSGVLDSGIDVSGDGRVAVEWTGLAKVHADQPSHSRSDANAGLVG